jgi:hypothetical protein
MTATLNTYLSQVQRFIHDGSQRMVNPEDLIRYINRARRETAMRAQCLRVLTPISGSIVSASVVAGGTGYTAPTVSITIPDFPNGNQPFPMGAQATGVADMENGVITGVNITFGGSGYFQPLITIVDPTGVGASITPVLTRFNQTAEGQEVYPFSEVDLSMFPGIESIYMIKSVSLIYANYRYSLPMYSFSTYQSRIRQYPFQYQYVPTLGAQFGQGTSGSFYLYPIPSTVYQLEFDAFCLPMDLIDNRSVEAIPDPWTDLVPYFAASLALAELQNGNASRAMLQLHDEMFHRYSSYVRPGRVSNPYGKY